MHIISYNKEALCSHSKNSHQVTQLENAVNKTAICRREVRKIWESMTLARDGHMYQFAHLHSHTVTILHQWCTELPHFSSSPSALNSIIYTHQSFSLHTISITQVARDSSDKQRNC